ncbi:MAG: thioredoxin domain-containing protein, partial [Planctomycetota bacterium]
GARGFFYTADDHERLITRGKDLTDNATPGGNSLAATALVRLGKLTGDAKHLDAAHATLTAAADMMHRAPMAMGQMLIALDLWLGPTPELVLSGDDGSAAKAIHRRFLPRRVLASRTEDGSPLLEAALAGKEPIDDAPTLYVCENHACQEPIVGSKAIEEKLAADARG